MNKSYEELFRRLKNERENNIRQNKIIEGRDYTVNVSGNFKKSIAHVAPIEKFEYGVFDNVRIYLLHSKISFQPGDIVTAKIVFTEYKHAFGDVVENKGCFLDEYIDSGERFNVNLTSRSRVNVRDAISDPYYFNGGLFGSFAIIRNVKFKPVKRTLDGVSYHQSRVKVVSKGLDKNQRYVVITEPQIQQLDDLKKEIFVGIIEENPTYKPSPRLVYPNLDDIQPNYFGLQRNFGIYAYFNGDTKAIIKRNGVMDISNSSVIDGIEKLVNMSTDDDNKIVITGRSTYEKVNQGIVELGYSPEELLRVKKR